MAAPFRLRAGDPAPVQQSKTTCGSACLTVARMLVDPGFARWIRLGVPLGVPADAHDATRDPRTEPERFAAYEQVVVRRTNGLCGPDGRLQLAWPRALGTPPWGALRELESVAGASRVSYRLLWTRTSGNRNLRATYDRLRERVREDRPALLYVGNAWLPRHVVLVLPSHDGSDLAVYEPTSGRTLGLPSDRFEGHRLDLGGWNVLWAILWPSGH